MWSQCVGINKSRNAPIKGFAKTGNLQMLFEVAPLNVEAYLSNQLKVSLKHSCL